MAERKENTWLRLRIPHDLHDQLKSLGEEKGSGIIKQALEQLRVSLDEPTLVQRLIEFFEQGATNIEISRRRNLLSLAWTTIDGKRRRVIYDSETDELLQNLHQS